MGTLVLKHSELTREHFERYPVWAWVDDFYDESLVTPVLETDPLPEDSGAEFIKADFTTPAGRHFDGFVIGGGDVMAIELFVAGKVIGFNVHLRDFAAQSLAELRQAIGDESAPIFPLSYRTNFRFAGKEYIAGTFNPFG